MLIHRLILKRAAKAWRKAPGADVPTVCVGNITVGGTGKTPHTEMILRQLRALRPELGLAVLSRGYKRKSKGYQTVQADSTAAFAGDEPLQIKRKFPAVNVAVDKNRVEGCKKLVEDGAGMIVLDDAFQYKKLHASLNVVLVNYNRPIFEDHLLPFGRLRDLPSRIADADVVIVSKCPHEMDPEEREEWRTSLHLREDQPLFFTTVDYDAPVPVWREEADPRYIYSKTVILFTGIADDSALRAYLSDTYKIVDVLNFPDHHAYSKADMRSIAAAVRKYPTAALLTTEKDAVRVLDCKKVDESVRKRLFAVPVKAGFVEEADADAFAQILSRL
ncbi:MAG: tetraacyldisaccharide 4'-kinase [Bacteroidales bacterium]|nr:tetraacyldisaccharide 4'-kinase [Bacteroidales bacterium]